MDGGSRRALRQAGDLYVERALARQEADVSGPPGMVEDDRLLVRLVAVSACGLDQVSLAIRAKAPHRIDTVSIARDGDVQAIDALALDLRREDDPLRRPKLAATRFFIVRDHGLLDDPAVRADEDRAELDALGPAVSLPLFNLDHQRARLGQEVDSARPADTQVDVPLALRPAVPADRRGGKEHEGHAEGSFHRCDPCLRKCTSERGNRSVKGAL